jgi:hypothetical protein
LWVEIITYVWNKERLSEQWKESVVPGYKKSSNVGGTDYGGKSVINFITKYCLIALQGEVRMYIVLLRVMSMGF